MKTFSIAELEQYSLIRAHTFRSWEQRYPIFKSQRTHTNIRYYSIEELDFLLDLSLLNRSGFKVSKLIKLDREAIKKMIFELETEESKIEHQINLLIISMFSFEVENFEFVLDNSIITWGIDKTVENIIIPFLERLQFFSYKEKRSGEFHFAVTVLRKKLILAIEQTNPKNYRSKSTLLFLPEGQHYDLLLLYLYYKTKKLGFSTLYLGSDISETNLEEIIKRKKPNILLTFIAPNDSLALKKVSSTMAKDESSSCFIASINYPKNVRTHANHIKLFELKEFDNIF